MVDGYLVLLMRFPWAAETPRAHGQTQPAWGNGSAATARHIPLLGCSTTLDDCDACGTLRWLGYLIASWDLLKCLERLKDSCLTELERP